MQPSFTNANGYPCAWKARHGAESVVYDKIKDIAISMKNTYLTLPDKTEIFDYVFLDEKERKIYNEFAKKAVIEFDNGTAATACNAAVATNKLQQLASGSIYTVTEDDEPTNQYETIHTKKLEMLKYIRENTDDNLIVAYYFNSDLDMIEKFCNENKITYNVYTSKNAVEIQKRWDANEISLLLLHPASAGFGLNLQYAGHRLIWYTLSFNLEQYTQTLGRIYRQGQTCPVFIHYLLTDRTVDAKVLNSLRKKDDSQQAMLDALEYVKSIAGEDEFAKCAHHKSERIAVYPTD
jgi:SNF2 family DNA or RNA helicase